MTSSGSPAGRPAGSPEFYLDLLCRMAETIADELGMSLTTAAQDDDNLRKAFVMSFAGLPAPRAGAKPDLVIDISSNLVTPAATQLGDVRECWRYDGAKLVFYEFQNGAYAESSASLAFPFVQAEDLAAFLEQSETDGADTVLWRLRMLMQKHKPVSN